MRLNVIWIIFSTSVPAVHRLHLLCVGVQAITRMSWSAAPEASSLQSDDTLTDKTLSSCWRSRNLSTESLSMLKRLRVRSLPADDRNTEQLEEFTLNLSQHHSRFHLFRPKQGNKDEQKPIMLTFK